MRLGTTIAAALATVALASCVPTTVRTGVVTEVDLRQFRRIHISGSCDAAMTRALRDGLLRRGLEVSEGPMDAMRGNAELRVECAASVMHVPSMWSSSGQTSYTSRLFLVFLEARSEAVVATGEVSGPPRDASAVDELVEAILDQLYGPGSARASAY
jgi:hypothetical protein